MTRMNACIVAAALVATVAAGLVGCGGAGAGSSEGPGAGNSPAKPVLTLKGAAR